MSGPAYMRLGRGATPLVYGDGCEFTIGEANVLRDGSDATIVTNGIMVSMALSTAEQLGQEGIDTRVVDIHTVKPLDEATIEKAAAETGAIVTAEEHSVIGGLGGAVAETLTEYKPTPMMRVGVRDRFGESSRSYSELLGEYVLTPEAIREAVLTVVDRRT
jgi:transketolase